jgi:S-adenosylmethionine/arginine decarboxylase-like enzyme
MAEEIVHQHLIASLQVQRLVATPEELRSWLLKLAESLKLKAITEPMISYSETPGNSGFLGLLGITTSHFSFHHWDCCEPGLLQFDLYTCRPFDARFLLNEIDRFWTILEGSVALITRGSVFLPGIKIASGNVSDFMKGQELAEVK